MQHQIFFKISAGEVSILVRCLQKLCTYAFYSHFAVTFQGKELLMRPEQGNAACPSFLCPSHRLIYLAGPACLPVLSPGPSGDWTDKACDGPMFFPIMAYLLKLPFFCSPLFPVILFFSLPLFLSCFRSSSLSNSLSHG